MNNQNVITKKGYVISKTKLNKTQQEKIRKELTVKPFVLDDPTVLKFPVYEEDNDNFYLPKYYGIENYGDAPNNFDLSHSQVEFNFKGKMRPLQQKIIDSAFSKIKNVGGGILHLNTGFGKCLSKNTPVLLYNGLFKRAKDIKINDYLMGDDSTPRKVLSLGSGFDDMYKISYNTKFNYIVNSQHILSLKKKNKIRDINIANYIKKCEKYKKLNKKNYYRGYRTAIDFNNYKFDDEIINFYKMGYTFFKNKNNKQNIENFILFNSQKNRILFLSGLIDYDGSYVPIKGNSKYFLKLICKTLKITEALIFLIRSLGFLSYFEKIKINNSHYYSLYIKGDFNMLKLKIKKKENLFAQDKKKYKIKIEKIAKQKYYGFEIDGNHRFIINDFSVTHNTTIALCLSHMLKLKTLVIVHKTFLMEQWYERIKQFTDAKIGTIRRKKTDVENKDIIIGMLQSISMIDYDEKIFEDIGVVIYDECHHFGSRVFSRALMKIRARYNIALSATPKRNDGLTKVLNWFMGDIIAYAARKNDINVYVKIFDYESNDKLFCEKKRWFKGSIKPDVVKMTNNLYNIDDRNQFIINILDILRKNDERKILVLSGRIDHLKILKEKMDKIILKEVNDGKCHENEYKTAFYIGEMKNYELKDAEEADVIFASFAMAEEGLDIDGLNTLMLTTPKKNIIQSIGRIMRKPLKEGDTLPLIIDITDKISVFSKWGKERQEYYKKCKYNVKSFKSFNKEIITVKDYMNIKKRRKNKEISNENENKKLDLDLVREYICYEYGEDQYELEKELNFECIDKDFFTYDANLQETLKVEDMIEENNDDKFFIKI